MTTITIDRALLEQALEALDICYSPEYDGAKIHAAKLALRAELAKPVEQIEPTAWHDAPTCGGIWLNSCDGHASVIDGNERALKNAGMAAGRWYGPIQQDIAKAEGDGFRKCEFCGCDAGKNKDKEKRCSMKPTVYTVHAYRWGDRECHSYTVGVFGEKHAALKAAKTEEEYRGGKYECEVLEWTLDSSIAGSHDKEAKVIKGLPPKKLPSARTFVAIAKTEGGAA